MTNLSSLAITQAELDTVAHHLAYESATSLIEGCCPDLSGQGDTLDWFDVDPNGVHPAASEGVAEAVIYLEARGLLERRDDNPNWVTLFDESEATR